MKKYTLTDESIEVYSRKLHRIRALKDFSNVKAGDIGGYVESELNLSHFGDCWLYDSAKVYGSAEVRKRVDYLVFGNVGSRYDTLTAHRDSDVGVRLNVGCFSGSLQEDDNLEQLHSFSSCPSFKIIGNQYENDINKLREVYNVS